MKSNRPIGILALVLGGISLFLGIVIISIGLGSVVPAVNKISAPIICSGDQVEIGRQASNPRPGETFVSIEIACTNEQTGIREVRTLPMIITSGLDLFPGHLCDFDDLVYQSPGFLGSLRLGTSECRKG
jgi:hypothetical protein